MMALNNFSANQRSGNGPVVQKFRYPRPTTVPTYNASLMTHPVPVAFVPKAEDLDAVISRSKLPLLVDKGILSTPTTHFITDWQTALTTDEGWLAVLDCISGLSAEKGMNRILCELMGMITTVYQETSLSERHGWFTWNAAGAWSTFQFRRRTWDGMNMDWNQKKRNTSTPLVKYIQVHITNLAKGDKALADKMWNWINLYHSSSVLYGSFVPTVMRHLDLAAAVDKLGVPSIGAFNAINNEGRMLGLNSWLKSVAPSATPQAVYSVIYNFLNHYGLYSLSGDNLFKPMASDALSTAASILTRAEESVRYSNLLDWITKRILRSTNQTLKGDVYSNFSRHELSLGWIRWTNNSACYVARRNTGSIVNPVTYEVYSVLIKCSGDKRFREIGIATAPDLGLAKSVLVVLCAKLINPSIPNFIPRDIEFQYRIKAEYFESVLDGLRDNAVRIAGQPFLELDALYPLYSSTSIYSTLTSA